MSEFEIISYHIYPIKSLGGQTVVNPKATPAGFEYDRHWMLVDADGNFQTQREFPKMALLAAKVENGKVYCYDKHNPDDLISFDVDQTRDENLSVKIWSDKVKAPAVDLRVDEWFSDQLHQKLRLVARGKRKKYIRKINQSYPTRFPDAYPYLILSTNSLDEINSHLEKKVSSDRFRANIIIEGKEGSSAFFEDQLEEFLIGKIPFQMIKQCGRCPVVNTDQDSGEIYKEPLKSLATYRNFRNKVMVGMNAISLAEGFVH